MKPNTLDTRLPERLVIFDGVCNFCNASINFIIRRDPQAKFSFASSQSAIGSQLLDDSGMNSQDPSTFVLIKHGVIFIKSNAAIELSKDLSGAWPAVYCIKILPLFIRYFAYDLIAANRYKLMGKRDLCMVPSDDLRARFLD